MKYLPRPGLSEKRTPRAELACTRLTVFALALAFLLTSCNDSGGDPPPPENDNEAPTAALSVSPATVEAGGEVSFDGSDSSDPDGDDLTFAWDFGDGNSASGETATHTYDSTGDQTATLTVNDPEGATDSRDVTVTVTEAEPENQAPEAVLELSDTQLEVGDELTADATESSDPDGDDLTFEVAFGDGEVVNGAEATHVFATAGDYTVTLTASDGALESTDEKTVTVTEPEVNVTVRAQALESDQMLGSHLTLTRVSDGEVLEEGPAPLELDVAENVGELQATADRLTAETRVFADTSETFTLEEHGGDIVLLQRRLMACNDGISNDDDDLVDEEDPGCSDGDGGYDPTDDSEVHVVTTVTTSGFRRADDDTLYVDDSRESDIRIGSVVKNHPSLKNAVGPVVVAIENIRSTPASFRLRFETGPDDNNLNTVTTTESTTEATTNGFTVTELYGITKHAFRNGGAYRVVAEYESGGRTTFLVPGGEIRVFVLSWVNEEADATTENQSAARQASSL